MVYDQHNEKRYAIAIVQASSDSLGPADDQKFAEGFDKVAAQVLEDTQIKVGFFIDPIPRDPDPTNNYGCRVNGRVVSTYAAQFKPDPETTGPWLRKTSSILGIHAYSPEGWIDGPPQTGPPVDECFKREWKKDFSRRWFETGIPFLQDVTPGYDGHILFTSPTGLHTWGYNQSWWNALLGLTSQNGFKGLVYNSWNGYCEGLAGMPTQQQGLNNVNFIRALTRIY
jgi:hypothetical protein